MIQPKQKTNSGSRELDGEGSESEDRDNLEDDVDALFKLPLAEFTGARNNLAARLKREGRADDSNFVKALAKPSISAWAVNQLHWNHREAFDRLLATSQQFRQSQTSHTTTRMADLRASLDARREALSQLSDLATVLLREAGHNPTPDTIHRITTTLEALSAHATLSGGPTPGRLSEDVDPPSFASLAALIPGIPGTDTTKTNEELTRVIPSQKSGVVTAKTRQATPSGNAQKVSEDEETRRAGIAAAKVSLQEARRSLTEAQRRAQRSEAAQKTARTEAKKADAEARQAEKHLRDAEQRFNKASAASQDAAHRAERICAEAKEAAQDVEAAERTIKEASKELELFLQEKESAAR
jgi:hypothetical protein